MAEVGERTSDPALLLRLLDDAPACVILVEEDLTIRWVNAPAAELFGYAVPDSIGTNILDYLDPEWDPEALASIATALGGEGRRPPMVFRVVRSDGSKVLMEVTANVQTADPVLRGIVAYVRPWDERFLIDEALDAMAASEPLDTTLALLVRIAESDTLDAAASILHGGSGDTYEGAVSSHGLPPILCGPVAGDDGSLCHAWASLLAGTESEVYHLADLPRVLAEAATAAGFRSCWIWKSERRDTGRASATVIAWRREERLDADQTRCKALARLARLAGLVVERAESEASMAHAATHDSLTSLANRGEFYRALEAALAANTAAPSPVGVLYIDLDGFKPVNDTYGHAAGDRVLVEVARRMTDALPPRTLAARLGGDEFAVLCPGMDRRSLNEVAQQVLGVVSRPIHLRNAETVSVGASIGLAATSTGSLSADQLVEAADRALYEAKEAGGTVRSGGLVADES
ncbi:MAG: diguanylate cyclase [Acidimicrobiia bacterium]|nr:diguanylate cyclase [Acidimicrobiia bacterium]